MRVFDAHIHIPPYEMMKPEARRVFLVGKPDRAAIEGLSADPSALLRLGWTPEVDTQDGLARLAQSDDRRRTTDDG